MRQTPIVLAILLVPIVSFADARLEVQDTIARKPTALPRASCGSTMACSVVVAIPLCDCRFDLTLGRVLAKAKLRLMGTIYYFRGSFRSLAEKARDRSVVDQTTAIEHEYAYHITPAVKAVAGLVIEFQNMPFATIADCMLAGSELARTVSSVFQQTLAETQMRELALR